MFLILHPQPNWATTLLVDGESAISVVANIPPKTDSFCSANRPFAPKGTDRLQTTIFSGAMLVFGSVLYLHMGKN